MAQKRQGLGRGFDTIFGENSSETDKTRVTVPVSRLEARKDQPRKNFDDGSLESLAASIKEYGILQPLVVRESGSGFYQIIAGERRFRAAKMAGLTEVPVIIITADDLTTAKMALVENVQREDLNPMEEAEGYRELSEVWNMTQEEIAAKIGKSRSAVANAMRLCDLDEEVKEMVKSGRLSSGHARALITLPDKEDRIRIATAAADGRMTVRETESAAKKTLAGKTAARRETPASVYVKELEDKVRRVSGRRVKIAAAGKSKSVKIYYENNEDLDEILSLLCGKPVNL